VTGKNLGGMLSFSNCHMKGLDHGSLVLIVFGVNLLVNVSPGAAPEADKIIFFYLKSDQCNDLNNLKSNDLSF
jgi:hypothetical protein